MPEILINLDEYDFTDWDGEALVTGIEQFNDFLYTSVLEKVIRLNRVINRSIIKRINIGAETISLGCVVVRTRGAKATLSYTVKDPYGDVILECNSAEIDSLNDLTTLFNNINNLAIEISKKI